MQLLFAVFLFAQLQLGLAVKSWMFKTCEQNPFCQRNRLYAENPDPSMYTVSADSVDVRNPQRITGNILKNLTPEQASRAVSEVSAGQVVLPFVLEVTMDNLIHFVVDEKNRRLVLEAKDLEQKLNAERFDPSEFTLDAGTERLRAPQKRVHADKNGTHLVVAFGNGNSVSLEFAPLKLTVFHQGEEQVVLNKNNYFNFEHLRAKQPDDERSSDWEDRFDKYTDHHVRGPESIAVDTAFTGYTHLYGIPEHADSLDLKDTTGKEPYRLFNVDIFEYETNSTMPMYGSIPLITSQKPGHAVGVFWLNSADTYVDISKSKKESSAHWISETGKMNVYIIVGEKPSEVLESYGILTGRSQLPQLFSLGYHQCRWNYQSQNELLDVNTKMDEYEFPYDVIWLDIDWTDDRRYFAWNLEKFPDSEGMMSVLDETKRKLVVLNDPHIKARPDYEIFTDLRDNGVLIKDPSGTKDFHAHCWPGESAWVDSLNPKAWPLWRKFHALGTKLGGYAKNLHLWSDMSEPSVFSGSESTAYKGVLHYGGWQHRDVHNVYGHTIFNMTYDALLSRYNGEQRPFILTRSFFAGSQRLGPTWTGDNQAEWEYLRAATPTILTLNAVGYPFAGADVGGFFRNPSDELLLRWYQSGLFYPFFRAHAHIESRYREPYLPSELWRNGIREAIELRYQLLPEFYTAFRNASEKLQPIMRPLFYVYPDLEEVYGIEDQFFVGEALMAKPITSEHAESVEVVIPGHDIFYDYFTGEEVADGSEVDSISVSNVGPSTIPLYVRGGHVVFRKDRKRRSSELMKNDPYTLLIAVNRDGSAYGQIYVDDGVSFDYERDDDYLLANVEFQANGIKGTVVHPAKGSFADQTIERIIVYGADAVRAEVSGGPELGVLSTKFGFVIRKPNVKIGENWVIQFH